MFYSECFLANLSFRSFNYLKKNYQLKMSFCGLFQGQDNLGLEERTGEEQFQRERTGSIPKYI